MKSHSSREAEQFMVSINTLATITETSRVNCFQFSLLGNKYGVKIGTVQSSNAEVPVFEYWLREPMTYIIDAYSYLV